MNVVLIVVDSLRASSLDHFGGTGPSTPFLDRLSEQAVYFPRAYATECWTLPTHVSMFTGLMPSDHGAHFQTMGYRGKSPTVAEILADAGHDTEVITRNFIFDGQIPGVTRGFQKNTRPLADWGALNPMALILAAFKPRFRRALEETGFFRGHNAERRSFMTDFAKTMMPADVKSLEYMVDRMAQQKESGRPYFFFCNLYDVHAPYPPREHSLLQSFGSLGGCLENAMLPWLMPQLSAHAYLRPGFRIPDRGRQALLRRYHRAIELMDAKLESFYMTARDTGLLDDTLLVITSDHGEAFGEHNLYLHDASVYDTHLHVPLWIHHPSLGGKVIGDVVSTRELFDLMRSVGLNEGLEKTFLDREHRTHQPVALAEHFRYPHVERVLPRYQQNIAAALVGTHKVIARREGLEYYDLLVDRRELDARIVTIEEFETLCRRDGFDTETIAPAISHLRSWIN